MTVDIHTSVSHNLYGQGEIVKIKDDKVYVLFGNKQRIFPYPSALEKGYLKTNIPSMKTEIIPSGAKSVELTTEDIKHRIMVIKINRLYEENMDSDALYSVVRGIWKASIRRWKRKAPSIRRISPRQIFGSCPRSWWWWMSLPT